MTDAVPTITYATGLRQSQIQQSKLYIGEEIFGE